MTQTETVRGMSEAREANRIAFEADMMAAALMRSSGVVTAADCKYLADLIARLARLIAGGSLGDRN